MASRHEPLDWLEEKNLDIWTRLTTIRNLVWSPWAYPLWTVEGKTIQPNARERESALLCSLSWWNPHSELYEWLWRITWMLEAGNYRRLYISPSYRLPKTLPPERLWITTLICCLGQSLSLETPTDSPSLTPMRLRKLCTNFSPKKDEKHPELLAHSPHWRSDSQEYSQNCLCYPIWSFWIPRRSAVITSTDFILGFARTAWPLTKLLKKIRCFWLETWQPKCFDELRDCLL